MKASVTGAPICVDVLEGAVLGCWTSHDSPGAPAGRVADVVADVREQGVAVESVAVRCVPGKVRPLPVSAPNSTNMSVGATHLSCTPSCASWPSKNAW